MSLLHKFLDGLTKRPAAASDTALDGLIAPLPDFAKEAFRNRAKWNKPPCSQTDLFAELSGWMSGAGIAEGRGGYPGGRHAPGWTEYVRLQRSHIAIYHALVQAFGPPAPFLAKSFDEYERSYPPPVRRMGEDREPHIDDVAGRLIYCIPVDADSAGIPFFFPVQERDLTVLLHDPFRRAVLEVVGDAVLRRSMIGGNPEVTELDFKAIRNEVLHSTTEDLAAFIAKIGQEHGIDVNRDARKAMERSGTTVQSD